MIEVPSAVARPCSSVVDNTADDDGLPTEGRDTWLCILTVFRAAVTAAAAELPRAVT